LTSYKDFETVYVTCYKCAVVMCKKVQKSHFLWKLHQSAAILHLVTIPIHLYTNQHFIL